MAGRLTTKFIASAREPGRFGDGDGLYLHVRPAKRGGREVRKSWVLRIVAQARRRDIGLGPVELVTLAEARAKALELRKIAHDGGDPRPTPMKVWTFDAVTSACLSARRGSWRSQGHADRWLASVTRYASADLGKRPVETITTADIMKVLEPIWLDKHSTADRLFQRLKLIFDFAIAKGYYPQSNPVPPCRAALPKVTAKVEHMASLPWARLPDFMSEVAKRDGMTARCLEFIIYSASRSGEARGARWSEIIGLDESRDASRQRLASVVGANEVDAALEQSEGRPIWCIPAERMKANRPHLVPLSEPAVAVLESVGAGEIGALGSDVLIFPSPSDKVLTDMTFKSLFKRMKVEDVTTHGFRSTFRTWATDHEFSRELAEVSLSHAVAGQVEQAYIRTTRLRQRRPLMDAWGAWAGRGEAPVAGVNGATMTRLSLVGAAS